MKIDDKVTPYAAAVRMHFLDVNDNIGWKRYDMLHWTNGQCAVYYDKYLHFEN